MDTQINDFDFSTLQTSTTLLIAQSKAGKSTFITFILKHLEDAGIRNLLVFCPTSKQNGLYKEVPSEMVITDFGPEQLIQKLHKILKRQQRVSNTKKNSHDQKFLQRIVSKLGIEHDCGSLQKARDLY